MALLPIKVIVMRCVNELLDDTYSTDQKDRWSDLSLRHGEISILHGACSFLL
jgi:hypothetical protein